MENRREFDLYKELVENELKATHEELTLARENHKEILGKLDLIFKGLNSLKIKVAKLEVNSEKLNKVEDLTERLITLENSDKGFKKLIPIIVAIGLVLLDKLI